MPASKRERAVTITDVANRLGLSPSTVSRGLNYSNLISPEVREMVVRTAREMGYENRRVKRHATRTILNIKLVVPEPGATASVTAGDLNGLVSSIRRGFSDTEVNIVVNTESAHGNLFSHKKLGDIDAGVFAYTKPTVAVERVCISRHIPIVLLNRMHSFHNWVACDDCSSIKRLLKELTRNAKRDVRPAFVCIADSATPGSELERGYIEGCHEYNLPIRERDIIRVDGFEGIRRTALDVILKRGYSAVVCQSDSVAIALYQAAALRGIQIPREFSLTGFGNSQALELVDRRIDTIDPHLEQLGYTAAQWLQTVIIERASSPLRMLVAGSYVPGETI